MRKIAEELLTELRTVGADDEIKIRVILKHFHRVIEKEYSDALLCAYMCGKKDGIEEDTP